MKQKVAETGEFAIETSKLEELDKPEANKSLSTQGDSSNNSTKTLSDTKNATKVEQASQAPKNISTVQNVSLTATPVNKTALSAPKPQNTTTSAQQP